MAFEGEKKFIDDLKATSADHKKVIEELFKNPDFIKIWKYLKECNHRKIILKVESGLTFDGAERFGGYTSGKTGKFVINNTKKEHKDNPMELVDTIIHECIHAVMDLKQDCGKTNYPFGDDVLDLYNDPKITGFKTSKKKHVDPNDKKHLDDHYGDGASNPKEEYLDINDKAQELIIKIIKDLMKKTKVGKKTLTFENDEKRQAKKNKGSKKKGKGCMPVLILAAFCFIVCFLLI